MLIDSEAVAAIYELFELFVQYLRSYQFIKMTMFDTKTNGASRMRVWVLTLITFRVHRIQLATSDRHR